MDLLKAAYNDTWDEYYEKRLKEAQSSALEPLELSKPEENVVIARMKKLARDADKTWPNALALVHAAYEEQEWERQSAIGDLVRPTPSDRKAWKQYMAFIETAVKLLAKYHGIDGNWRTDRFDTIPTNQRASMGSMAAARVKESVEVRWESSKDLNILAEALEDGDTTYKNDCIVEGTLGSVADRVAREIEDKNLFAVEGVTTEDTMVLYIYDDSAETINSVTLKLI